MDMPQLSNKFNINNIFVTSVYVAEETVQNEKIQAVLSIEHPGAEEGKGKAPIMQNVTQKILCFWDTENPEIEEGPSHETVQKGLDFIEAHKAEKILIHCKAGKCRSVGMALGWLAKEYGIEAAITHIKKVSPKSAPNLLVVEICDEIYGFEGALTKAMLQDSDFTQRRIAIRSRIGDLRKSNALERR